MALLTIASVLDRLLGDGRSITGTAERLRIRMHQVQASGWAARS
jgi:hypothetical protein